MARKNGNTAMRPPRPSRKRQFFLIGCIVALLALIGAAIIVNSVQQQHLHLDNGTVWITSLHDGKTARFNPVIKDADAAVAATSSDFDVSQSDNTTLLSDDSTLTSIDAAHVSTGKQARIPRGSTTFTSTDTAAIFDSSSGKLWLTPPTDLDALNDSAQPTLTLPRGSQVTMGDDGALYAYRSSDGVVLRFADATDQATQMESLTAGKRRIAQGFAVVGGTPVVLAAGGADGSTDSSTDATVYWPSHKAALQGQSNPVLQASPVDGGQSGFVAVAGSHGISLIDLKSEGVSTFAEGGEGSPAQPVSVGGCVFGAWAASERNYIKLCGMQTPNTEGTDAGATDFLTLPEISATSELLFRTNHRTVVLNDAVNGNVWNPNDSTDVIKIEWNKLDIKNTSSNDTAQESVQNHEDFTEKCSSKDSTIKAVDDSFGARAGSEQILDALRNDQQTSCTVLRIEKTEKLAASDGTIARIYDGRYLQLHLSENAHGTIEFTYSISDGQGQTSSATVSLTVEEAALSSDDDTSPTQSDTPPDTSVEEGASVTVNALDSFTDPDGDPLTLSGANVTNSDGASVTTRADGQLVFDTGSVGEGRIAVQVSVSDGVKTGRGTLYFSIATAGSLKPVIDPITRTVEPGKTVEVHLDDYVHSNSAAALKLTAVKQPDNASASANTDDLSLTFSSATAGTHYVHYTVAQGEREALGMIRFDVAPLSDEDAAPVAANDVALLDASNTAIVEPLNNDEDPLGGVLAVTSVSADADAGIKTGVVNHKRLYITAQQVPTAPITLTYTVANERASSSGTIVVQPPNLAAANTAPSATDISADVRQNGIVTVEVMDHVTASDGTDVTLSTKLGYDKKTFSGLAFVSGDTVRYQASSTMGDFPLTYTVTDNLGNTASATITLSVHQRDAKTKAKPQPAQVEAQVVAGQKVKISITLIGIDRDGDDVSLLGLGNTAPKLGRIDEVGADYLIYEAYPDSVGTDTFQYAVEDWSGQRTTAEARVGILASSSDNGVYARDDSITMRPGRAVDVPVTQNDISEDGKDLSIGTSVESADIDGVKVNDSMIEFTTPQQPGDYYIVYTAQNEAGISDTATLTVHVSKDAAISSPTALDDLVPAAQTVDRRTVEIDVADFISNPSGTMEDLSVAVHPSASAHARLASPDSTVISIDLTDEARAIPYTVTNTRYHLTSTAFIQVPAYGVFPPLLRPKAPALRVNAGDALTIRLADYVRVGAGKQPHVQSEDLVSATHSDGSSLYADDQALTFRAPKNYSGPASITFTVADAAEPGDSVSTATLTLPITVVGKDVAPPTFSSTTVNVVAGENPQRISLAALTTPPAGFESVKSHYAYHMQGAPKHFSASVSAQGTLTVSAASDVTAGTTDVLTVLIRYDGTKTIRGAITLKASATNRPLARVPDATLEATAGKTSSLNVLSDAYNPFPDTPLTLSGAASTIPGLSVKWSASGTVSVTPSTSVKSLSGTILFTVTDATKAKNREVSAKVHVSVKNRPSAPRLSPVGGTAQDGRVTLSWSAASPNGSPVTDYEVDWGEGTTSCGQVTQCVVSGLRNGSTYSFRVRAKNEVGWSDYSNSITAMPDVAPSAPVLSASSAGIGEVAVTWRTPHSDGSPITSYSVAAYCAGTVKTQTVTAHSSSNTVRFTELPYGTCSFSARSRNAVGDSPESTPVSVNVLGTPGKPQVSVSSTAEGRIRGTATVETQGQKVTRWVCSISGDGNCSVTGGRISAILPGSQWYEGQRHMLTVTAEFDHAAPQSTSAEISMDKLSVGAVQQSTFIRKPGGRLLEYTLGEAEKAIPSDAHPTARIVVNGCPSLLTVDYQPGATLSAPVPISCTGHEASVTLYVGSAAISSTARFAITDEAATPEDSGKGEDNGSGGSGSEGANNGSTTNDAVTSGAAYRSGTGDGSAGSTPTGASATSADATVNYPSTSFENYLWTMTHTIAYRISQEA